MKVWVEPIVMGGKFVRFGAAAGTRTHCAALAADPDQASELAVPLSRISIQVATPALRLVQGGEAAFASYHLDSDYCEWSGAGNVPMLD